MATQLISTIPWRQQRIQITNMTVKWIVYDCTVSSTEITITNSKLHPVLSHVTHHPQSPTHDICDIIDIRPTRLCFKWTGCVNTCAGSFETMFFAWFSVRIDSLLIGWLMFNVITRQLGQLYVILMANATGVNLCVGLHLYSSTVLLASGDIA